MADDDLESSFDDFYRGTCAGLVRQLYALTGSAAEAQDCVQEAYARAWQQWGRVRGYDDPQAWVGRVARRVAVSRWRRARTALAHLRRQHEEPQLPAPSEDHAVLVAALRSISTDQRVAVVLHHLSGLSVQEVADQTGVAVGTVKARLHRGRAALALVIGSLDLAEGASGAAPLAPHDPTATQEASHGR